MIAHTLSIIAGSTITFTEIEEKEAEQLLSLELPIWLTKTYLGKIIKQTNMNEINK